MRRLKAVRLEHSAIAIAVLLTHVAVVILFWLVGQARMDTGVPDVNPELIYIRKVDATPRPVAPGNPDPVEFRLVPLTSPQPRMPRPSVIPVDILDAPLPGPDPAPSAVATITAPGPGSAGDTGDYGAGAGQGLKVLQRVVPRYPMVAGRRGEQGRTFLLVHIDDKGRPVEVKVAKTSGYRRLDEAAVQAARKWRFEPMMKDGRAVDTWTALDLGFSLFRYNFTRIHEQPAGAEGELVRDGATDAGVPGGETALRRFLDDLATGALPYFPGEIARKESAMLRTALGQWGTPQSVRFMEVAGEAGTRTHKIKQDYVPNAGADEVAVQWEMYEVRHGRLTSVWRVAIDRSGEIWSAHAGPAPWVSAP
jgi:protein TonB